MTRPHFRCLIFSIFVALVSQPISAQLRIDSQSFGGSEEEIRAVVDSVVATFPAQDLPPLFLTHGEKGPITLYEKNLRGEIVIQLSSKPPYWSQFIYQFAHELMHVRAGYRRSDSTHLWLEETLCEAAALFALRRLSVSWREKPPLPSLRTYRQHLHLYAQKIILAREKLQLDQISAFYKHHQKMLHRSPRERPLNGAIAAALLPLFQEAPSRWLALSSMNHTSAEVPIPLEQRFRTWWLSAAEEHRPFIEKLRSLFLSK